MEKLEAGEIEYEMAEEFLTVLKKEFGKGEEEAVKVVELRKLEQEGRTIEEFVQEFKRAARGSRYEGRPLVEEFKRGINEGIRRKLIEIENLPASIEQWYKRTMALDKNWRESRREEERLKSKKETMGGALKQEQKQIMLQPLVWQRRQQLPQQAPTGPAPMEGIERMNIVVVREQRQGQGVGAPPRRDPYAMEIDRERNCYVYGGFGHMACHCRNKERGRAIEGRRVEYRGRFEGNIEQIRHLKEVENLEALN